jgi:predicted alpha-1,2-mannosidase
MRKPASPPRHVAVSLALLFLLGCSGGSGGSDPAPDASRADEKDGVLPQDAADAASADTAPADSGAPEAKPEDAPDPDAVDPACASVPSACGVQALVSPRIGSGEVGYRLGAVFVGAAAPFGFAKVGPDTSDLENGKTALFHCAGYWYPDDRIDGFVHTHPHGIGVPDYSDILFMPTVGMSKIKTEPNGYRSPFDHANEIVAPGFYAVRLDSGNIDATITASQRGAIHRYSFPPSKNSTVIVDASYSLPACSCDGAAIHFDPATGTVTGFKKSRGDLSGRFGGYTVHFKAVFTPAPTGWGTFTPGALDPDAADIDGPTAGAYFTFDTTAPDARTVEVRVALSFVDKEGAANNYLEEIEGRSFEEIYQATSKAWEDYLSPIQIAAAETQQKVTFYTALYHTMLMPTVFSDADGRYVGFDKKVHTADWGDYYTDFSMWDTYRTVHPLYILLFPKRQTDMLRSFNAMTEHGGGFLPKWAIACGESNCMIGTPADAIVADSYLKGLTDFDYAAAYDAMYAAANGPPGPGVTSSGRSGILDYIALGYVPQDKEGGSVSKTQEYTYADYCIGKMASALGKDQDAATFAERAAFFKNLWYAEEGFFRARNSDGSWFEPFKPLTWQDPYVEGNAWQYLWYPPHDVPGMASLMGGNEPFLTRLQEFFQLSKDNWNDIIPSPYYFHGNEPDIQAPFYFSLAGDPDRTSTWVDWVIEKNYSNEPHGLAGNDDAGTLSAWYVFAALGLYPFPCMDTYTLHRPRFEHATVKTPVLDLTVDRTGSGQYLSSIAVDGTPIDRAWLTHSELVQAKSIVFTMGDSKADWALWEDSNEE